MFSIPIAVIKTECMYDSRTSNMRFNSFSLSSILLVICRSSFQSKCLKSISHLKKIQICKLCINVQNMCTLSIQFIKCQNLEETSVQLNWLKLAMNTKKVFAGQGRKQRSSFLSLSLWCHWSADKHPQG